MQIHGGYRHLDQLERLRRYIPRSAVGAQGGVPKTSSTPYRDEATQRAFEPLDSAACLQAGSEKAGAPEVIAGYAIAVPLRGNCVVQSHFVMRSRAVANGRPRSNAY